jgi:hypothetical protein
MRGMPVWTVATWESWSVWSSALVLVSGLVLVASIARITAVPASVLDDWRRYLHAGGGVGHRGIQHDRPQPTGVRSVLPLLGAAETTRRYGVATAASSV